MNTLYILGLLTTASTIIGVTLLYRRRKTEESSEVDTRFVVPKEEINSLNLPWERAIIDRQFSDLKSLWNFEAIIQSDNKIPRIKTESYEVGTKFQYAESLTGHNNNLYLLSSSTVDKKKA